MKVLFTGGGTLGSVTPLLAVWEELRTAAQKKGAVALWVGTYHGPERTLIESAGIPFLPLLSGKFRRYVSFRNFFDLFFILGACVQSFFILACTRPDVVVSAGGYVGVPLLWIGRLFFRVRIILVRLDIRLSLAHRLSQWCADSIACGFVEQVSDNAANSIVTGIPVRKIFLDQTLLRTSQTQRNLPTLLIIGGGTGARFLNELVWSTIDALTKMWLVIHITGSGKGDPTVVHDGYEQYELLGDELAVILRQAACVVTRGGMGVLSEIGVNGVCALIIPISHPHQEENACFFARKKAAIFLSQHEATPEVFLATLRSLLTNEKRRGELAGNLKNLFPRDGAQRIARMICEL